MDTTHQIPTTLTYRDRKSIRRSWRITAMTLAILTLLILPINAAPWRFGIIGDTQWSGIDDGQSPNSVAAGIINRINRFFVDKKVTFVVAVGDLTDNGSTLALDTRATYVQELYNAGIGFFPLRGNHEPSAEAAQEFIRIFPQTQSGVHNQTPQDSYVSTRDDSATHPVNATGSPFNCGSDISSPDSLHAGLSYTFTYKNFTAVMLDQYTCADGSLPPVADQFSWMDSVLTHRTPGTHALVFGHTGLLTQAHADNLFGANPASDSSATNTFLRTLKNNDVRRIFCGHDHMHDRSIISPTNADTPTIEQCVIAPASDKFYTPVIPSNDEQYDSVFHRIRQYNISQDLYRIGATIVTIDGPLMSVDYYSFPGYYPSGRLSTTPVPGDTLTKRERYGYGLNGREFLIHEGGSFSIVNDSSHGTSMRLLSGSNSSGLKNWSGCTFVKRIGTGWSPSVQNGLISECLTLWGMEEQCGSERTSPYCLSMSYRGEIPISSLSTERCGIVQQLDSARWERAVDGNYSGSAKYIIGPFDEIYPAGTFGVDTLDNTAWAVLDHAGTFAVATFDSLTAIKSVSQPGGAMQKTMQITGSRIFLAPQSSGALIEGFSTDGRRLFHHIARGGEQIDLNGNADVLASGLVIVRCSFEGEVETAGMMILRN